VLLLLALLLLLTVVRDRSFLSIDLSWQGQTWPAPPAPTALSFS
jgi:hypothetical protein